MQRGEPDIPGRSRDRGGSRWKSNASDTGELIVRAYKGRPFYEAMWRNGSRRQRKRRLVRAWLEQDPSGTWIKRRGRVLDEYLEEKRAYRELGRLIAEGEAEPQPKPEDREALFDDAASAWLDHLENERRAKPSTGQPVSGGGRVRRW